MTKFARFLFADLAGLLILAAAAPVRPACAQETDWRFHGFASQRLTATSGNNNFFGRTSDGLSADYSEIGAGFSWRPHTRFLLAGQAIYRRGGESEEGKVEPDYLFLAYTPITSDSGNVTLRLGKIKVPYGLYNELRDTPMTRPGILPPQSIYLDSLRQFNQSAYGLHIDMERGWGDDTLALRFSQIKPNVDGDNAYWSFLGDDALFKGTLHSRNNDATTAQLAYDHDGGKLRALISHAAGPAYYRPGAGDLWSDGRLDISFTALSLQLNGERLSLSWEKSRNIFKNRFDSAFVPDVSGKNLGVSEYLQAEWHFSPHWSGLLRYDTTYLDQDDRDGTDYAANNPGKPAWSRFTKDWTLGVHYHKDEHWLLAAEFHRVHGVSWLPPADNLTGGSWIPGNTSERWNMLLLQATYQF
jgi:hypothetical protein